MNQDLAVAPAAETVNEGRPGVGEVLAYGSGNFAEMMIFNPATTFMVFFYTDIAGIAAATVATFMLISRAFDLLNPAVGVLVDRTRSRHGKARPWLLWMAIPFGATAVLLFTAPSFGPVGKVVFAFITYNLALTIIYPFIDVPYAALLSLITQDQQKRTSLSLSRMVQSQFGGMVSFAITLPLVKYFGGGARGWQSAFIVFGVIATSFLMFTFFMTKERVKPVSVKRVNVPLKDGINSLIRNKYWLLVAGLISTMFVMIGFFGGNLYYCRYFLHDVNKFGPLMTVYQIVLVCSMIFLGPPLKKFGKRKTALLGTVVAVSGQALMFLAPSSYAIVLAGTVIKAIGSAPLVGTLFAMVADTIEYGEWKFGVRAEGLAFGTIALAAKIFVGLGNVMVGWLLGITGYVNGAETQSASVLFAVKAMFLHIPLAILIFSGFLLWIYKLDDQYPSIVADLKLRRDAAI